MRPRFESSQAGGGGHDDHGADGQKAVPRTAGNRGQTGSRGWIAGNGRWQSVGQGEICISHEGRERGEGATEAGGETDVERNGFLDRCVLLFSGGGALRRR